MRTEAERWDWATGVSCDSQCTRLSSTSGVSDLSWRDGRLLGCFFFSQSFSFSFFYFFRLLFFSILFFSFSFFCTFFCNGEKWSRRKIKGKKQQPTDSQQCIQKWKQCTQQTTKNTTATKAKQKQQKETNVQITLYRNATSSHLSIHQYYGMHNVLWFFEVSKISNKTWL